MFPESHIYTPSEICKKRFHPQLLVPTCRTLFERTIHSCTYIHKIISIYSSGHPPQGATTLYRHLLIAIATRITPEIQNFKTRSNASQCGPFRKTVGDAWQHRLCAAIALARARRQHMSRASPVALLPASRRRRHIGTRAMYIHTHTHAPCMLYT